MDTMQNLDIQGYFEKSSRFDQLIMMIQSGIKYTEQLNNIKSMSVQLEQYLIDFAKVLLNTVSAKDHYTGDHSLRVSMFAELFADHLGLDKDDHESLVRAGLFHDIGKIGISDNILLKETKLTDYEYESIKLHPIIGANILSVSNIFKASSPAIRGHHERYDGTGYPDRLKGENIPYLARVLALCDTFDAIVSARPYKTGNSVDFAIEQITKNSGTQFDPNLSKRFIAMLKENPEKIESISNNIKPE
ncbi:Cyclic di-GMP phosphodiesterase response regulator RpfG [compost metagenome]